MSAAVFQRLFYRIKKDFAKALLSTFMQNLFYIQLATSTLLTGAAEKNLDHTTDD